MKICINGEIREMTPSEIAEIETQASEQERQYWQTTSYDEAVDAEIRKRYTASQEFAILRQRDEKPVEYAEYYVYCEQCKAYVKEKQSL
jgi:hypothetical protein